MTTTKKDPQKNLSDKKTADNRHSNSACKDRSVCEEVCHFSRIGDYKVNRAPHEVRGTGPDAPRNAQAKKK